MDVQHNLNCCAVGEISLLEHYEGAPEKAMKDFCKGFEQPSYALGTYRRIGSKLGDISAFYVFTGVVGNKDGDDDGDYVEEVSYGPEFAAYILKNRLGRVVESPARYNRVNHPTHLVKVWVWAPSVAGLNTWWEKHK